MKRGALLGSVLALGLGCQMSLPDEPYSYREALSAAVEREEQADLERLVQVIDSNRVGTTAPEWMQGGYFDMCRDGLYDDDTRCIYQRHQEIIDQSVYKMEIKFTYKTSNGDTEQAKGSCSATLLEGGFVLTARHCTEYEELDASGTAYESEFMLVRNGKRHEIKPIFRGSKDFAILKLKEEADLPYFPYALGDTRDIQLGNFTWLFGCLDDAYSQLRTGVVTKIEPHDYDFGSGFFLIENGISYGDSGGPVIGFRDGMPEMIGINVYRHPQRKHENAGGVLRMDRILREIRQQVNKQ